MEAAISRPLTAVARVFFARFATLLIIIIATLSRPSSATSTLLREGRNGFWPQYFYLPVAAASASGLYYDHYRLQPHPSMWRQASENVAPDSINIEQKASEADARISEADEIELHLESRLGSVDITENNVARQSNTSTVGDCCWKVKVAFTTNNLNGAYKLHKYIFGYYTMEPGLVNGRNHYTSTHADGAFALAFCGDSWWLQSADVRGECKGWAHSGWQENRCVHDIDYSWRYFIPAIDEFVEAKKGLSVWCKS